MRIFVYKAVDQFKFCTAAGETKVSDIPQVKDYILGHMRCHIFHKNSLTTFSLIQCRSVCLTDRNTI